MNYTYTTLRQSIDHKLFSRYENWCILTHKTWLFPDFLFKKIISLWQEMKNERRDHGCVHFSVEIFKKFSFSSFPCYSMLVLRMMRFISSRTKVAAAVAHTAAYRRSTRQICVIQNWSIIIDRGNLQHTGTLIFVYSNLKSFNLK